MSRHASLARDPADLIAGRWIPLRGDAIVSHNPARPDQTIWHGASVLSHVNDAVAAARAAQPAWAGAPVEHRAAVLRRYAALCAARAEQIAHLISDETGKVLWESRGEAATLPARVESTLQAAPSAASGLARVTDFSVQLSDTRVGRCVFRPHGVMAIIAPYNFPAYLPNGQYVPALLMGNTIVLKPSDKTPAVGQLLAEIMHEALSAESAPAGVFNLVQGAADVSSALTNHDDIDGILFTGSWPVGRSILEANLDRPGRIIALEMGGNNPAVVMPSTDLRLAAVEIVRCAFNTTGQRCTSTRRTIIHEAVADRLIPLIKRCASTLVFDDPRATHPVFAGPMISRQARQAVLDAQSRFARAGGRVLLQSSEMTGREGWFLTPSIIQVERFTRDDPDDCGCDTEVFGPLLRVSLARDLDDAIQQSNATRYGLTSAIFTADRAEADRFCRESRAGCINVNTGTAGATPRLPIGGLGMSGNHRPAGSFTLDCCAYPVAQQLESNPAPFLAEGMTIDDRW
ncbi:MAG: aldehyde dehydrogenase family protein [Phycisphaerales bacterium]|nr:aldehyde dehydrogenase family protein [Phycisphaerales bacterium]